MKKLLKIYYQIKIWNCEKAISDIKAGRFKYAFGPDFEQECIEHYTGRIRVLNVKIDNL